MSLQKGSELSKDFAVVWVQFMFEAGTSISSIIRAIHNPAERVKWDKELTQAEVPKVENNNVMIWH